MSKVMFSVVLQALVMVAASAGSVWSQEWKRLEDTDPMTDERRVAIATGSLVAPSCSISGQLAVLQFQCENNKMIAAISTPGCVFEDNRTFDYRVDKNEPYFVTTKTGSDPSIAYLYEGFDYNAPHNLFLELIEAKSVIFQIEPFAEQPEIVSFDLTRMREYAGSDFDTCLPAGMKASNAVTATSESSDPHTVPSLQEAIKQQLRCEKAPKPGDILGRMRNDGLIDTQQNIGFDSLSCFEIKGGLTVDEMSFTHVCGFEEDESIRNMYPDIFYRGPGSSPGQVIEFFTDSDEASAEKWLISSVGALKADRQASSDYVSFAKTSVGCSSWIAP